MNKNRLQEHLFAILWCCKVGEKMNQDKMHLINKIFKNETIRTVWNKEEEKYYISVVDIVSALLDDEYMNSRNYWKVLKHRLKKEGNETVTKCNQLKLKATDGKYRLTHLYNTELLIPYSRIISQVYFLLL